MEAEVQWMAGILGKGLDLVPLKSLYEVVELLVILKNSVTPYLILL